MKVAITGGTSSVGTSLIKAYTKRGYEVVNISRSLGYDFKNIEYIVDTIVPCDIFVNCLHLEDIQSTLLTKVWNLWNGTTKHIINISTCNTLPNFKSKDATYHAQKITLEKTHWGLIDKESLSPTMCLVKLGDGNDDATWDSCCEYVVNAIETVSPNYLFEMAVFK
jgi:NADP-dependent 3-hydroxy acid dehydrogenase YdfG